MKRNPILAIAAGAVVIGSFWLWRFGADHDEGAGADDQAETRRVGATRAEASWPPAFPWGSTAGLAAPEKDQVELCGYGPVSQMRLPPDMESEAVAAIRRAAEVLERSADDRKRALALSTRAMLDGDRASRAVTGDDLERCLASSACLERIGAAYRRAAVPAADALARTAARTADPETYASALRLCQSLGADIAPVSCAGLRVEQWAQLDPDNGLAWMQVAAAAAARKDDPAFQEALLRASRAKLIDWRVISPTDLIAGVDVSYEPVHTLALSTITAAYFGQPPPQYAGIASYCIRAADPAQRDTCNNLARLLVERDPSLIGRKIGVSIGEKTGWSDKQSTQYKAEQQALEAESLRVSASAPILSCEGSAQLEQWLQGVMKQGEVGHLRQRIAQQASR